MSRRKARTLCRNDLRGGGWKEHERPRGRRHEHELALRIRSGVNGRQVHEPRARLVHEQVRRHEVHEGQQLKRRAVQRVDRRLQARIRRLVAQVRLDLAQPSLRCRERRAHGDAEAPPAESHRSHEVQRQHDAEEAPRRLLAVAAAARRRGWAPREQVARDPDRRRGIRDVQQVRRLDRRAPRSNDVARQKHGHRVENRSHPEEPHQAVRSLGNDGVAAQIRPFSVSLPRCLAPSLYAIRTPSRDTSSSAPRRPNS